MILSMPSQHPRKQSRFFSLKLLAGAALIAIGTPAFAVLPCVNPGGTGGCFSSINAAIDAASPGSIIRVAPGTYKEAVIVWKPLSLIGANASTTIIDGTGLSNAMYVDGLDNPGLRNVLITGFTLENSNFEGLLVTNTTSLTIRNNQVQNNDVLLDIDTDTCPGQPPFETGEDFDCGEGIHIMGVAFSSITNNLIQNNSGGILISDDTGETHDNIISGNTVQDNPFDCGITLASHGPYGKAPGSPHSGIVNNTISNNQSIHNGFDEPGAGAGIGFFSDGSGPGLVHGNLAINNELLNNGIPGIAFHSHVGPNFGAPADDLNDNILLNNHLSGNGADVGDTPTAGPTGININSGFGGTPITGTIIWGNRIDNESIDVAVNTPGAVDLHFNNLLGGDTGVDNVGSGKVNAINNYWGCVTGPGTKGCSSANGPVTVVPFLSFPVP
jgi:parallel beta-helix repeat protein